MCMGGLFQVKIENLISLNIIKVLFPKLGQYIQEILDNLTKRLV